MRARILTIGTFPIVQINESDRVLSAQCPERILSYVEGPVATTCAEPVEVQITSVEILKNISDLKKKWVKGGGCPSTMPFDKLRARSGTVRLNSIFEGFEIRVLANG